MVGLYFTAIVRQAWLKKYKNTARLDKYFEAKARLQANPKHALAKASLKSCCDAIRGHIKALMEWIKQEEKKEEATRRTETPGKPIPSL